MRRREFVLSATAATAALTGCVGGADGEGEDGGGTAPPTRELSTPLAASYEEYAEETTDVVRKDGIPSVDEPKFNDGGDVEDGDPVFGVVVNGEPRAYPQDVLAQHEIANDTVGGKNIAVTYCPLTGTAMGFERGGTTFGVSGDLLNSNLVMYDRATDTRYPQVLGAGVEGELRGGSLVPFGVTWTTWGRWRDEHPDSRVLSRDTGYVRNYDDDPYGGYNPKTGYYSSDSLSFPVTNRDERFHPKKVFIAARDSEGAVAFDKRALREEKTLSVGTETGTYTAEYDESLDTATVERDGDAVVSFDAMWFAVAAFYPDIHVA
jgi:hypothetical protein